MNKISFPQIRAMDWHHNHYASESQIRKKQINIGKVLSGNQQFSKFLKSRFLSMQWIGNKINISESNVV